MFDHKTLDELTTRITNLLPPGAAEFQRDMEKNLRAILSSVFTHLDLVPREEFDIQKEQLDRVQDRVALLERQIDALLAKKSEAQP